MNVNPKALLRRAIDTTSDAFAIAVARLAAARFRGRDVVVLDIDNTLADSWPTFLVPHDSETARLASISPLPGMKAATFDEAQRRGAVVMFLSHRHLWHYPVTLRWLRTQGYGVSPLSLMLVSSAQRKPAVLAALRTGGKLDVWDDLSAGHEHGSVRHYDDVRAEFERIATRYFGLDDIAAVVERALNGTDPS